MRQQASTLGLTIVLALAVFGCSDDQGSAGHSSGDDACSGARSEEGACVSDTRSEPDPNDVADADDDRDTDPDEPPDTASSNDGSENGSDAAENSGDGGDGDRKDVDGGHDADDPCSFDRYAGLSIYDDADTDGIPDAHDNCPETHNPDQADADSDGIGDACDSTSSNTCKRCVVEGDSCSENLGCCTGTCSSGDVCEHEGHPMGATCREDSDCLTLTCYLFERDEEGIGECG